jgi:hypothetical protein
MVKFDACQSCIHVCFNTALILCQANCLALECYMSMNCSVIFINNLHFCMPCLLIILISLISMLIYVAVYFSNVIWFLQFSLRSRTPSLNGSLYSPYNSLSRKVSSIHSYTDSNPPS